MDLNLTLIAGRLAVPAMIDTGIDGQRVLRTLVLTRSEKRRRIDVIPIRMSDPDIAPEALSSGRRVFVAGRLMRRCETPEWESGGRIEVVAHELAIASDVPESSSE